MRSLRALGLTVRLLAAGAAVAQVASAGEDVTPPIPVATPAAEWPPGVRRDGDVIVPVVLHIDAEGRVESADLEAGVGEPFDSAALVAAKRFRFEPARDASGPRRAIVRAIVRFERPPAVVAPECR